MSAAENLILTITAQGAGKLSSSHDYPVRGRGGMGVTAMDKAMRGGELVASFPVEMDDQIMLATSTGQSIRVPVEGIASARAVRAVCEVFNTGKNEEVVSVAWIADQGDDATAAIEDAAKRPRQRQLIRRRPQPVKTQNRAALYRAAILYCRAARSARKHLMTYSETPAVASVLSSRRRRPAARGCRTNAPTPAATGPSIPGRRNRPRRRHGSHRRFRRHHAQRCLLCT